MSVADFQHEVESVAQKNGIRHPCGDHGRECAAAAEGDGDGMGGPIQESDQERLPDADGNTAASCPAPTQTEGDAD